MLCDVALGQTQGVATVHVKRMFLTAICTFERVEHKWGTLDIFWFSTWSFHQHPFNKEEKDDDEIFKRRKRRRRKSFSIFIFRKYLSL